MPIVDYVVRDKRELNKILISDKISQKNKDLVWDFSNIYKQKPSTRSIMWQKLYYFLQHFEDFEEEMQDYNKVIGVLFVLSIPLGLLVVAPEFIYVAIIFIIIYIIFNTKIKLKNKR
tara:strand:+ start:481 stop:831 length:351 start_codon:yes stop_codon:yes gene_type:complete